MDPIKDRADDGPEVEIIREVAAEAVEDGPFGIAARARGFAEYTDLLAPRVCGRED